MKYYYLFFTLALVSCRSTSVEVGAPQDTTAQDSAASDSAVTDTLASDTNAIDSTSPDTLASDSIVTPTPVSTATTLVYYFDRDSLMRRICALGIDSAANHTMDSLMLEVSLDSTATRRSLPLDLRPICTDLCVPSDLMTCKETIVLDSVERSNYDCDTFSLIDIIECSDSSGQTRFTTTAIEGVETIFSNYYPSRTTTSIHTYHSSLDFTCQDSKFHFEHKELLKVLTDVGAAHRTSSDNLNDGRKYFFNHFNNGNLIVYSL